MHIEPPEGPAAPPAGDDLAVRRRAAELLLDRAEVIVADTVAVFPLTGPRRLDAGYCVRLGALTIRLIGEAVLTGSVDPRSSGISDLLGLAAERDLAPAQLFPFTYLALGTALDELSHDPGLGATTEPWPLVSQSVRRAAVDMLAAWTSRARETPSESAIVDTLTTLHTRPLLEAVLAKECYR
ncbi:MAG: hypothetical protein AB7N90_14245, partial [Vicinamibacterales bacterium]